MELGRKGIRVNAVQPGFAPGSDVSPLSEEHKAQRLKEIPLGRTSGPRDAPHAVLYLASSEASFVNGAVLATDGGFTTGLHHPHG